MSGNCQCAGDCAAEETPVEKYRRSQQERKLHAEQAVSLNYTLDELGVPTMALYRRGLFQPRAEEKRPLTLYGHGRLVYPLDGARCEGPGLFLTTRGNVLLLDAKVPSQFTFYSSQAYAGDMDKNQPDEYILGTSIGEQLVAEAIAFYTRQANAAAGEAV